MNQEWNNARTTELFNAFLQLQSNTEVANFCRDLLTPKEIEEFASRWEVAQELYSGKSQRQVATETGVSIATVTRVNQWLQRGTGGYKLVLERMHHHHIKLATAS